MLSRRIPSGFRPSYRSSSILLASIAATLATSSLSLPRAWAGDFVFDNGGVAIPDAVTTTVSWTGTNLWNPDGFDPSGLWDNAVFNATGLPTTFSAATVLNIDLGSETKSINQILQIGQNATNPNNLTINLVATGAASLKLNRIVKSSGGLFQVGPAVPITVEVSPRNPLGNLSVVNTDDSQLQLQSKLVVPGDVIKDGSGAVRFGTSGTAFSSEISGNIIVNNGSIEGATNNVGNPFAGTGRAIILNGPNATVNFRPQVNFDFVRDIDIKNNATLSADRSTGSNTGQVVTVGNVTLLANDKYLTLSSGNAFGFKFDSFNIGANTVNIRNSINGTGKADVGVMTGSGTVYVSGSGGNSTSGISFSTPSPAFSGTFQFFEGGGHQITATGALGSGTIKLGFAGNVLPITFPNPALGPSGTPTVLTNPWSALLAYNANNPTTAPVAVTVEQSSQVNMGVVPNATDVIRLQPFGIIQGNSAELAGFTIGSNLLVGTDAIISHEVLGGSDPTGLGTTPAYYHGFSATLAGALTIGTGTPWKGLSTDRFDRTFGGAGAVLTVNGGDNNPATIETTLLGVQNARLLLFSGGGTWASGNGSPVTVEIRGQSSNFGQLGVAGQPGGSVQLSQTAAASGLSTAVVDKFVVNSGNFWLNAASGLGGVPVEINAGGGLDISNTASIDGNVTINSGGSLLLNDNFTLSGTGTITLNGGSKLYLLTNTPPSILSASTQTLTFNGTGHTVRVAVDNIAGLDAAVPDAGAAWIVSGGGSSTAPLGTTLTGVATLTDGVGFTTDGGVITNDTATRALIAPLNIGNSGATFAATTNTSLVLMNSISAGATGTAPLQVGSLTAIDNLTKIQNPVSVQNSNGTIANIHNASPQVIFENGLKSGTINLVTGSLYFDGLSTNTKITGNIIMGEGTRLYLGDGGSIATGNQFGGAAPQRSDLTALLVAPAGNNVTTGFIQVGNYARVEMGVDPADPAWAAALDTNGRAQINQAFVVVPGADLMPSDRRNFWVNRAGSGTIPVDFNDITLGAGASLGMQESGTDIRATIKLNGDAKLAADVGGAGGFDLKNVVNIGGGAKTVTNGRLNNPFSVTGIYGIVDSGITFENLYGRVEIRDGSTIPNTFVYNDNAANPRAIQAVQNTAPSGYNAGSDHTLSIYKGETGVAGTLLTGGTFNINYGNAVGGYVDDGGAQDPIRNTIGATINFKANDGVLFSARGNATDSSPNGIVRFDTVNVNGGTFTLATRDLTDLEVGTLNIAQNSVLKVDGARSLLDFSGNGAVRIENVIAGTNSVHFQDGRTTITGNLSAGQITAGGTSLDFNPGTGNNSTVNATGVRINSLLAARAGTTNFGTTVLSSVPVGTTVAGLREGVLFGNSIDITTANPGSDATTANRDDQANLGIRLDPRAGQNNYSPNTSTNDTARGWSNNQTWVYTGQVFDADGTFTFAENVDDSVEIKIDGQRVLFSRNTPTTAGGAGVVGSTAVGESGSNGLIPQAPFDAYRTVTNTSTKDGLSSALTQPSSGPEAIGGGLVDTRTANTNEFGGRTNFGMGANNDGWHDVEIRMHNGSGGAGASVQLGWGNYFGLGMNSGATTSFLGTDYTKPVDNGSMNLFRTTTVAKGNIDVDGGASINAGGITSIGSVGFGRTGSGLAELILNGTGPNVNSDADIFEVLGFSTNARVGITRATDKVMVQQLNIVDAGDSFTLAGAGRLVVAGTSAAGTGSFTVSGGTLVVNGAISGNLVTVQAAGTLAGTGTVQSTVTSTGGSIAPGDLGIGTLTTTGLTLDSGSTLKLELSAPGVVGGPSNDLLSVNGAFTLDGTLQVATLPGFGVGTYRIANYTGVLTNNTLSLDATFLAAWPGSSINTATSGQVNLIVIPEPSAALLVLGAAGLLAGLRRYRRE